jgi:hypothetical protein
MTKNVTYKTFEKIEKFEKIIELKNTAKSY